MFEYYKIKANDTVESIASKFNVSPQELIKLNRLQYNYLRENEDILIPKYKEKYFNFYTIEKGDSLYKISQKYNINPKLLASLNGLNMDSYIYPNQEILIPKSGYSYYITSDGDTLNTVASTFNITQEELIAQNNTIYLLGDQLLISKRK